MRPRYGDNLGYFGTHKSCLGKVFENTQVILQMKLNTTTMVGGEKKRRKENMKVIAPLLYAGVPTKVIPSITIIL